MLTVRERERKNRQAIIASKKNREVAMRHLKTTMSRVRQRESEEEDRSRNDLSQRMGALLSLKKNIELSKVRFFFKILDQNPKDFNRYVCLYNFFLSILKICYFLFLGEYICSSSTRHLQKETR